MSISLTHILRPYMVQSQPLHAAVYSRFYTIAHTICRRSYSSKQKSSGDNGYTVYRDSFVEKGERTEKAMAIKTEQRIQKLRELNALHWPRIQHPKDMVSMSIPEFRTTYKNLSAASAPEEGVQLRGRILSVRKQSSKLLFLDIQGDFHTVQILLDYGHINAKSGATLEQYKEKRSAFLRGDFISVDGTAIMTPQGEITLKAIKLPEQLSPSLAPVPTKLISDETKVQSPHLNLLVNRNDANILRYRSELIWSLRNFFVSKRFLEVQTPILGDYAGGAAARPFLTSATEFPHKELALRIAPELWLKRMVVGGFDRIFEIGPAFRNEGLDGTHNPEFTMCEFYQAYANLPSLIDLTQELIQRLAIFSAELLENRLPTAESMRLSPTYFSDFEQLEFIPALESALDMSLPDLTQADALDRLSEILHTKLGHEFASDLTLNKMLDTLANTYLEPNSESKPTFIIHHPACMSPLSKSFTCPKTGQLVSARAELFIKGSEIANMYEEENDPFEQRRKFELQLQARNAGEPDSDEGQAVVDESYIQALEHGLPPTGGWGCGVDRLVMLFTGTSRISDTLSFGNLRNVVGVTQGSKRA